MKIYLNQEEILIQDSLSILDMLTTHTISISGIAVAVNNQVIKKELWQSVHLCENDKVTVIVATFGG